MKKTFIKRIFAVATVIMLLSCCGCKKVDKNYANKDKKETVKVKVGEKVSEVEIPSISSDDLVMPKYLDISIYDVENYAKAYLGKDFSSTITYCDNDIKLPTTYQKLNEAGWNLSESQEISLEAMMKTGEKLEVMFVNPQGKSLKALFYNPDDSSKILKDCKIVKIAIDENYIETNNNIYGDFWISGVGNAASINDIIEALGAPSHFYAVNSEVYYLDYFYIEKDKRSRITFYVNVVDDYLISASIARY